MRGLGYIPDHEAVRAAGERKRHVVRLIGSFGATPNVDHRVLVEIENQQQTSMCTGEALHGSVRSRSRILGLDVNASPKALYDVGRLVDEPHKTLTDAGARPSAVLIGARKYGLVAADRWAAIFDAEGNSSNIDVQPPLDVFLHGIGAEIGDDYRIPSGAGASTMIRRALADGFFPEFAMYVGDDYSQLGPNHDPYNGPSGDPNHMQYFCGSDDGFLWIAGSWGADFADAGFVRVRDEFIDRNAQDIIVPTVIPSEVS